MSHAIRDRLMASVRIDAINGDGFERSVVRGQILEAISYIDEQSSKIATLKAALIADREELIVNGSSYVIWRYQNNIDPIDPNWGLIKSHAKEELAQEYPDIFKEE